MIVKRVLLLTFLLISQHCFGQLDSLMSVWGGQEYPDSIRIMALHQAIDAHFVYTNPDSAMAWTEVALLQSKSKGLDKCIAESLRMKGKVSFMTGNFDDALQWLQQSLEKSQAIQFDVGIARNYNNIARVNAEIGNYTGAIDYYEKSLAISASIKDKFLEAELLNSIGYINLLQGNNDLSIQYFDRSKLISKQEQYHLLHSYTLNNTGTALEGKMLIDSAISYYRQSLEIKKRINNTRGIAYSQAALAKALNKRGAYDAALEYIELSLKLRTSIDDKSGVADAMVIKASVLLVQGKIGSCIQWAEKGLAIAKHIGVSSVVKDASEILYKAHKKNNNISASFKYLESFKALDDSLKNISIQEELLKHKYQNEYEKKVIGDSINFSNHLKMDALAIQEQNALIERNRYENILLYGGLFTFVILVLVLVRYLKLEKTAKLEVTKQKNAVELHRDEMKEAKFLLEERNEEIKVLNSNLESTVTKRTQELKNSLDKLQEHQWELSHKIRGPIATIRGLLLLIENDKINSEDNAVILQKLKESTSALDVVIAELSEKLDDASEIR